MLTDFKLELFVLIICKQGPPLTIILSFHYIRIVERWATFFRTDTIFGLDEFTIFLIMFEGSSANRQRVSKGSKTCIVNELMILNIVWKQYNGYWGWFYNEFFLFIIKDLLIIGMPTEDCKLVVHFVFV